MKNPLTMHSTKAGLFQHKEDGPLDSFFLILVMILVTIGTVMMFSASYVYASEYMDDSFYFLKRQLIWAVGGIIIMLFISKVKIDLYKKLALPIMGVALFLLILVLFFHTTVEGSGESFKRWMKIPVIGLTFQPSDLAKIAIIIFFAFFISNNQNNILKNNNSSVFMQKVKYPAVMLGILAVVCALVLAENHLSGTILIFSIGIAMIYLSGAFKNKFYILAIILIAVVAVFLIINRQYLPDYVQERIKSWLDEDYDPSGSRWQTNQSLYAIGSGGLFGTGLGGSKQKHLYLPEPQNDFIFAIVCEELGYIRTVGIILIFALLVWRGFYIGLRSKDRFSSLIVLGISFQVGLQTVLNIGVVTGMLPNTGISLPFFSYGGTALITLLAEMGIILSASRGIKKQV